MKDKFLPSEIMEMAEKIRADGGPDVDPALVAAVAMAETDGDPWSVREEKGYSWRTKGNARPADCTRETELALQCFSWGLMQVMGATARDLGFEGWLTQLLDPQINLFYGMTFLAQLFKRWSGLMDVISAYNAGHPAVAPDGRYRNQAYVDLVMGHISAIGESRKEVNGG